MMDNLLLYRQNLFYYNHKYYDDSWLHFSFKYPVSLSVPHMLLLLSLSSGIDARPGDPQRYRGSRNQEPGTASAEEDV